MIEGYVLEGELGRGGGGVVHRARHRASGRQVALKVLRQGDEEEVRALARLAHPGVLRVLDMGRTHGPGEELFVVTELLQGPPLRAEDGSLALLEQVLGALAHCHARGVLHLDIKPSNLVWRSPERRELVLIDFGVSRLDGRRAVGGTPGFLAPEVSLGTGQGPQTDLWAVAQLARWLGVQEPRAWLDWLGDPDPRRRPVHAGRALSVLRELDGRSSRVGEVRGWTVPKTREVSPDPQVEPAAPLPVLERFEWAEVGTRPRIRLESSLDALALGEVRGRVRSLRAPVLVEREQQLDALWAALGSVRAEGGVSLHAVLGPAGSGKTALIRGFCELVAEAGLARVWWGSQGDRSELSTLERSGFSELAWADHPSEGPLVLRLEALADLQALRELSVHGPVLVLLDGALAPGAQEHWLPPVSDPGLSFLLQDRGLPVHGSGGLGLAQGNPGRALALAGRSWEAPELGVVEVLSGLSSRLERSQMRAMRLRLAGPLAEPAGWVVRTLENYLKGEFSEMSVCLDRAEDALSGDGEGLALLEGWIAYLRIFTRLCRQGPEGVLEDLAALSPTLEGTPTLAAEVWARLGAVAVDRADWELAHRAFGRCLELGPPPGLRIRVARCLADPRQPGWDQERAGLRLGEVQREALAEGELLGAAAAARELAATCIQTGRLAEAEDNYQRALARFAGAGDLLNCGSICVGLAQLQRDRGDERGARALYRRALEFFPEGYVTREVVQANLLVLELEAGRPLDPEATEAVLVAGRTWLSGLLPYALLLAAISAWDQGRREQSLALAAELRAIQRLEDSELDLLVAHASERSEALRQALEGW